MRHLVAFPVIASALAVGLGGCQSFSSISKGTAPTVAEIQADAVSICGYLPTAETVASIATKASAEAAAGEAIGSTVANLICGAVTAKGARYGSAHAHAVKGVVIRGHFVK